MTDSELIAAARDQASVLRRGRTSRHSRGRSPTGA
jgi:hypothetical protein